MKKLYFACIYSFILCIYACSGVVGSNCFLNNEACMSEAKINDVSYYTFDNFPTEKDNGFILDVREKNNKIYVVLQGSKEMDICKNYTQEYITSVPLEANQLVKNLYVGQINNDELIFSKVKSNISGISDIDIWFNELEYDTKLVVHCSEGKEA